MKIMKKHCVSEVEIFKQFKSGEIMVVGMVFVLYIPYENIKL